MFKGDFMQLIVLLLLAMAGARQPESLAPLMEQFAGGGDGEKILREAQDIARIAAALSPLSPRQKNAPAEGEGEGCSSPREDDRAGDMPRLLPLEPVSSIADEGIKRALSAYICGV